jgi:hypothetical protein
VIGGRAHRAESIGSGGEWEEAGLTSVKLGANRSGPHRCSAYFLLPTPYPLVPTREDRGSYETDLSRYRLGLEGAGNRL